MPSDAAPQENGPRSPVEDPAPPIVAPCPSHTPPPIEQTLAASPVQVEGRLHPATLLFAFWEAIRNLLIPGLVLLYFGKETTLAVISLLFLIPHFGFALIRYFTFSYRLENAELVTRQGILEKTERHIPLERVQDIRIEQGLLHRLFQMAEVQIETASGRGAEAALSVLGREEAERLRESVFDRLSKLGAPVPGRESAAPRIIRQLNWRELVLAGITSNRTASFLAFLATLWAFADDLLPKETYERLEKILVESARGLSSEGAEAAFVRLLSGLILILAAGMLISVLGSILLFHGFTLSLKGEDLHRSYGLVRRRATSLPRHRIQLLQIKEGLLRRLFKLATVRADTAGLPQEEADQSGGRDVLIPILPRDELDQLLPLFFPAIEGGPTMWKAVSPLAIRRGTIKGIFACLILILAAHLPFGPMALWGLAIVPFIYWVNRAQYQNLGYVMGQKYFRVRRGWISRSTHIVPIRNIQVIAIRQTPFDRRLGLATLIIDTAGQAYTGGGPKIPNLPRPEAQSLGFWLTDPKTF